MNKPNLKENDIKKKMKKIKTKYTKINKKLKKLNQLKPKLVNEKVTEADQEMHHSTGETEEEMGSACDDVEDVSMEPLKHNKELNNNKATDENSTNCQQQRLEDCSSENRLSVSESNEMPPPEDKLRLKAGQVGDGTRVSFRQTTS